MSKKDGNVAVTALVLLTSIVFALSMAYYVTKWEYTISSNYADYSGLYTAGADGARAGVSRVYELLLAQEAALLKEAFRHPQDFENAWRQVVTNWLDANPPEDFSYSVTQSDGSVIRVSVVFEWRLSSVGGHYRIVSTAENDHGVRSTVICVMDVSESFTNIIESPSGFDYNEEHAPALFYKSGDNLLDIFWLYEQH